MAGHDVVYLCAGEAWWVPGGNGSPARLDLGRGAVRHLLGDPDGDGCVAVVDTGSATEVRVLAHLGAEPVLAATGSARLIPLAWLDRDTVLLGVDEDEGGEAPVTLVELDLSSPEVLRLSELSHLRSVDRDAAGRRVAITAGLHPAHVRGWRGGSRARLLRGDASGRWWEEPMLWANPVDACLLGDRMYVLDDPGGQVDVHSVALDGGPVRSHGLAARGAVTSLRRGREQLVVGLSGEAVLLRPGDDTLHAVPAPRAHQLRSSCRVRRWTAETSACDATGSRAAGIGEGRLVVVRDGADDVWTLPTAHGWVVAAGWTGADTLAAVVRAEGATTVLDISTDSADVRCRPVPADAARLHPDEAAVAPNGVVLSSATAGVLWVPREGRSRLLESRTAHRRGAPAVSADGSLVAWSEEDELAGAVLRVARTSSGPCETVTVPGAGARLPVFDSENRLLFVSTPVSPLTGTAAPVQEATVLCEVDIELVLDPTARTAGPSTPGVRVLARGLRDVSALTVSGSRCLVRDRSGVRAVDRQAADGATEPMTPPFRGEATLSRLGGTRVDSPTRPGEWAMRRCLDVIASQAVAPEQGGMILAAASALVSWADRCMGEDELAIALRTALRGLGQSHAALLVPGTHGPAAPPMGRSRVVEARTRARERLHGRAHYVAVPDVSTSGVRVVEGLCRAWRGDTPLVIDLRYNQGGPFADYLGALLGHLLTRDAVARRPGAPTQPLLRGPAFVNVLVNEHTGSGGEHLAALMARHPQVLVLGRRTAGAGTGFHRRWSIGEGRWAVVPQYRLGTSRSTDIENWGVDPDLWVRQDPMADAAHDDALLDLLPLAPATPDATHRIRYDTGDMTTLDEGGTHDRAAV